MFFVSSMLITLGVLFNSCKCLSLCVGGRASLYMFASFVNASLCVGLRENIPFFLMFWIVLIRSWAVRSAYSSFVMVGAFE